MSLLLLLDSYSHRFPWHDTISFILYIDRARGWEIER